MIINTSSLTKGGKRMPKTSEESKTNRIVGKQGLGKRPKEKIPIKDVARIFDLSEKQMRNYKMARIIRPVEKKGMQDLYDLETIKEVLEICKKYRCEGLALAQIAEKVKVLYEEKEIELNVVNSEARREVIQRVAKGLENGIRDLAKAVALL